MKKKRIAAFILAMTMVFSTAAVYASDISPSSIIEGNGQLRTVISGTVSMKRVSSLRGKIQLTATSSLSNLDYIKATVTVERNGSNGWSQYYAPYDIFGDAKYGDMLEEEYVDVKVSGTYRIKVVFSDKKGNTTSSTKAYYSQAVSL